MRSTGLCTNIGERKLVACGTQQPFLCCQVGRQFSTLGLRQNRSGSSRRAGSNKGLRRIRGNGNQFRQRLPVPRMRAVALADAASVPARNRDLSRDSGCRYRGEKRLDLFGIECSQSAMQVGPTISTHAVRERSCVEYSLALAGLQGHLRFGVQSAQHRACSWSHRRRHKMHTSCSRDG